MQTGIQLRAYPTLEQKLILSQWMGCARVIWNAKVAEEEYFRTFARKYYPLGTFAPIDAKAAHFKDKELTPWLYDCPSQIIRNSATNWQRTYVKFMKGECGRPRFKAKSDKGSIYLTQELFRFEEDEHGNLRLFIGTKTRPVGYLRFKPHHPFNLPKAITIRKERGYYFVSFNYEDSLDESLLPTAAEHLAALRDLSEEELASSVAGIDRGVKVPVAFSDNERTFDYSAVQKKRMKGRERHIKRLQRRMSKQQKGSRRRDRTRIRLSTQYSKNANVRKDFAHKTSRALVDSGMKALIFEHLRVKNMTRRATPKLKAPNSSRYASNRAAQKSGLNNAILNIGWHQIETFTKYKAHRAGVAVFSISPSYTSQQCSQCGTIAAANRLSQAEFRCVACDHTDNADNNAAKVIRNRAIQFIMHPGTGLSKDGVLTPASDTGRGGKRKTSPAYGLRSGTQRSVKSSVPQVGNGSSLL